MAFPDFQAAPNQGARPDLYELENEALDPDGLVLAAARDPRARVLPGSAEHIPLADHPGATGLSYGYVLFTVR
jgi:hypothetical protein